MPPLRADVDAFGAAENVRLPAPWPVPPDITDSHGTSAVALH
jgi:hypothetical protein